jgi:hypothetical protein
MLSIHTLAYFTPQPLRKKEFYKIFAKLLKDGIFQQTISWLQLAINNYIKWVTKNIKLEIDLKLVPTFNRSTVTIQKRLSTVWRSVRSSSIVKYHNCHFTSSYL